ncbi:MAG TPA: hypothetical protein VF810_01715, partial [Patescibacteria group bacterium]
KKTGKWVILAPRRSHRTNVGPTTVEVCPFCIGQESVNIETYRVGGVRNDSNWHIRVLVNKFPFTPHQELVIHSPDHHKNFDELPIEQVELIVKTYRNRFNSLRKKGQVYIFHNRGHESGESLPHPHTQIAVVPEHVTLDIQPLDPVIYKKPFSLFSRPKEREDLLASEHFFIFCPATSEWPDEVWIAPKIAGADFGQLTDKQLTDLAFVLQRVIQIFDARHGMEFPFNFYIYPGKNWYLRLIPRLKILGGFELGTCVIVNTQKPQETFEFIKEHFWEPKKEKITTEHKAEYLRSV